MNKINHSPLKKLLAQKIKIHSQKISEWIHAHAAKAPLPIYSSVDLRDSDYKIVPVDSNLYPAGFNNICPEDRRTAPPLLRDKILKEAGTQVKKILILPENNTHNTYYLENLYYLQQLLIDGGFDVQIGWYLPEQIFQKTFSSSFELTTASQKQLTVYPIKINQHRLTIDLTDQLTFDPDFILVNNDFSSGYPIALEQVQQPIMPSFKLGWHTRKKSTHFEHYNRLAKEFSELIQVDPWLIQIDSVSVDDVNFNEEQGIDRVAKAVEGVLQRTQQAYLQHEITHEPFAFVKNNSGTYGMGIMVVHSAEELLNLNRRAKNKMSVGKNHQQIQSVVIQEGIPTATLVDRLAAEPVIYLAGCELIGGFLRTNTERGVEENLNSSGMVFRKLCMTDLREILETDDPSELDPSLTPVDSTLELVYGMIARISALATGYELLERIDNSSLTVENSN